VLPLAGAAACAAASVRPRPESATAGSHQSLRNPSAPYKGGFFVGGRGPGEASSGFRQQGGDLVASIALGQLQGLFTAAQQVIKTAITGRQHTQTATDV